MIRVDDDFRSQQVGSKLIHSKNYCQQLFLSGRIVQLGIVQSPTCIIDVMGESINALPQNSSNSIIGRVTHDLKRCTPATGLNDWCGRQNCLQGPKCLLAILIKNKWGLFHQQLAQRPGDLAKILDESPIESCMAQKRANLFHCTWGWKVGHQIHLCLVNLYPLMRNNVPKYNPLLHHIMALLPVEHQVLLFAPF